jgi:hypothetical protein
MRLRKSLKPYLDTAVYGDGGFYGDDDDYGVPKNKWR